MDRARYTFTSTYNLGPGKNVYVHTGRGTNGSPDYQHRYGGSGAYIWNNTGDTAWGSSGSYTYC